MSDRLVWLSDVERVYGTNIEVVEGPDSLTWYQPVGGTGGGVVGGRVVVIDYEAINQAVGEWAARELGEDWIGAAHDIVEMVWREAFDDPLKVDDDAG